MNIMFWLLMVLMLLVAIAFLVYPILKTRKQSSFAYKDSNLKLYDEKVQELDQDLSDGRIDQGFYRVAREELDRELLIDIPEESQQTAALHYAGTLKRHPALAIMISVFVPMMAMLLYLQLGMHNAGDEMFVASQQKLQKSQAQSAPQLSVEEMVQRLEQRVEEQGGSVQEWIMLARSYKYLRNFELADKAFAIALENDSQNAQLMIERAEVMALNNKQRFTPEARDLILKAYAIQPENANAMWFAGVAEYQYQNYRRAIELLAPLLPVVSDEQAVVNAIMEVIAESRKQLLAAGEEVPELQELTGIKTADVREPQPQKTGAGDAITTLTVNVDVSDDVRKNFKDSDAVFVYAKAVKGPRMPLAVQRMTLAALPATVVLDDSMAMVEGMNLSAFDQLEVSARLTRSGAAITQSGDYIGRTIVEDKMNKATLRIVIDTLVP